MFRMIGGNPSFYINADQQGRNPHWVWIRWWVKYSTLDQDSFWIAARRNFLCLPPKSPPVHLYNMITSGLQQSAALIPAATLPHLSNEATFLTSGRTFRKVLPLYNHFTIWRATSCTLRSAWRVTLPNAEPLSQESLFHLRNAISGFSNSCWYVKLSPDSLVIYPNAPPLSLTCNRESPTPKAMFHFISYQSWFFFFILIISLLAIQAFKGFREFISLGHGGTPPNIFGYANIVFFQIFKPSKPAPKSVTGAGYILAPLQPWLNPPPTLAGIAPQRQTTQKVGQDVQNELWKHLKALKGSKLKIAKSRLEERSLGLFWGDMEVAHVHPSDGSLHIYLSTRDCEMVIRSRWGGMWCRPRFIVCGWYI